MRRYWVMFSADWEITAVEDHGLPDTPPGVVPAAYEPGEMGDWLFAMDIIHPTDPKKLVGKPFDLVFDAQDELAAFAAALAVCNQLREMCDEPLLGVVQRQLGD